MKILETNLSNILKDLAPYKAELVAVSKMQPASLIQDLYNLGQRDFGENYVQECCEKQIALPSDIRWHFIGHLQSNKVKFIIPFISLIHGVDSFSLLKEINKQAIKLNRVQNVLVQIHIASEETKFGFSYEEATHLFSSPELDNLKNIQVKGFMGMASFTDNMTLVRKEFKELKNYYEDIKKTYPTLKSSMQYLSMGMTADYKIALEEGSNLVRIGSALFGARNKTS